MHDIIVKSTYVIISKARYYKACDAIDIPKPKRMLFLTGFMPPF